IISECPGRARSRLGAVRRLRRIFWRGPCCAIKGYARLSSAMMARSRKHPWSAASGVVVLFASSLLPAQDGERAQPGSRAPVATNGAAPRNADDEFFPRNPTRCISTTRLDRTEVVDNETVLFYMRGGDIYRNRLSRSCPGLEREK